MREANEVLKNTAKSEAILSDYLDFLGILSRDDLLVLLRWEVQNRMFLAEELIATKNKLTQLEGKNNEQG